MEMHKKGRTTITLPAWSKQTQIRCEYTQAKPIRNPREHQNKPKKMRDVEVRMAEVVATEKSRSNLSETFDATGV
jgi:hypothetical protein